MLCKLRLSVELAALLKNIDQTAFLIDIFLLMSISNVLKRREYLFSPFPIRKTQEWGGNNRSIEFSTTGGTRDRRKKGKRV